MDKWTWLLIVMILIIIGLIFTAIYSNGDWNDEPKFTSEDAFAEANISEDFYFVDVSPDFYFYYSPFSPSMNAINLTVNLEHCREVPCDCHRDQPSCLTMCYECTEDLKLDGGEQGGKANG